MRINRDIVITLIVAFFSLLVGFAVLSRVKAQLVKASSNQYTEQQKLLAEQIADTLKNNLDNVQNQLIIMATMPEIKDLSNIEQCNSKLDELLTINQKQLGNLARVDLDGKFACSANRALIGQDTALYGSYIHDLINDPQHKTVLGRVSSPKGANSLAVGLHVPVYDGDKFVGTLGGGLYFARYQDQYLKSIKLGKTGHVVLMDDNGDILYHPSPDQNGKNLLSPKVIALFEPQDTMRHLVSEVKANRSGSFDYSVKGVKKIGIYKSIEVPNVPGRHWGIFVTVPRSDVDSAVNEAGINKIFITLLVLIAATTGLVTFVSLGNTKKSIEVQNMKDEFISLTSHQLRTPATIVKQYLGMLIGGYAESKEDENKYLKAAYDGNETQLGIIENILNVSRIKSGHMEINKQPIVVQDFVKTLVDSIKISAASKNHKITVSLPKKPIKIEADSTKLSMAIENLISNAIKYTKSEGKITISVVHQETSVLIKVTDSGRGIPTEELPKLFKRFNRLDHAETSNVPGTGLGLYLAKKIVLLHKGTISVESKEKEGSTFTISLPLG